MRDNLSVPYANRIFRLLIFIIILLIISRFVFSDLSEIDQLKYVLSASAIFMFMERYYPSVVIQNNSPN